MKGLFTILIVVCVAFGISLVKAQSRIAVGVLASPSLESVYEGPNASNIYGQKFVANFGAQVNLNLSKRFEATAGITHFNMGGEMKFVDSVGMDSHKFGTSEIKANYIAVPVQLDFNFWAKSKNKYRKVKVYRSSSKKESYAMVMGISLGLCAGYSYKFNISNTQDESGAEVDYFNMQQVQAQYIHAWQNFSKLYVGASLGLRATMNVTSTVGVFLRPNYMFQMVPAINSDWPGSTFRSFNCEVGVRVVII